MEIHMLKRDILMQAISTREADIVMYQVNIDNYRAALAILDRDYPGRGDLEAFRTQLQGLLQSATLEQTKEEIMLRALQSQMASVD